MHSIVRIASLLGVSLTIAALASFTAFCNLAGPAAMPQVYPASSAPSQAPRPASVQSHCGLNGLRYS
ncbi:MAG: hypothetical protein ABSE51_10695 [Terracidiphilus sp.]